MDKIIETLIEKLPRKMLVGLFAMWFIADYAKTAENINQMYVLVAMTAIGIVSVGTHFWLELKHPSNGEK